MSQRNYDLQAEDVRRLHLRDGDNGAAGAEDDGEEDDNDNDDDGDGDEGGDFENFMPFGDPSQLFVNESGLAVADILSDCAASLAGLHEEAAKLNKIMTFMAKKMKN